MTSLLLELSTVSGVRAVVDTTIKLSSNKKKLLRFSYLAFYL